MNGERTIRGAEVAGALEEDEEQLQGPDGDEVAAATRPAGAPHYQPWWKVWLPIPLLFVLFDVAFPAYFWRIPKLSGTQDDYSYQFLYDLNDLQKFRPDGVRVLAFGSSVTSTFDPYQIDGLLERDLEGTAIEVRRILRPGTKPSDFALLWQTELEAVAPDVVVPVFNLVDFIKPGFENNLKPGIRYILPPWSTLMQRWDRIPRFAEKVEMVLASVSNVYRYRKPIRSTLKDHVKLLRSWWRGGGGHSYGVFVDGYAKPRCGVAWAPELEYFVDPRWIEQRGRAVVRFFVGGELIAEEVESSAGWHTVGLGDDRADLVDIEVEGGWTPRASGGDDIRLLGVRLRHTTGDNVSREQPPLRYPPVEPSDIKRLLRMGPLRGDAYEKRWFELLESDTNFGHRYRLYRDAKIERSRHPFTAVDEFEQMRAMAKRLAAQGIRVVMVNTPENPLLTEVIGSQFYQDYRNYFEEIAASDELISFIDLHGRVAPEDLNDWHHLNFAGQLKVGPVLASELLPVVAAAAEESES